MKTKICSLFFLACFTLSAEPDLFNVPDSLSTNVDFWLKCYAFYDSHQVIYFHEDDLSLVYFVQDLPKIKNEISSPRYKHLVVDKFREIEKILDTLASGTKEENPSEEFRRIEKLVASKGLLGNPDLKKRLRYQNGLKSQFALGLKLSGRYVSDMRAVLKIKKLPPELIALVFVESLFYIGASSYAGAAGPWGIMKETGIKYGLHVNNFIDERFDPILSTIAAAAYLEKSKNALGHWSLAITSFNYGLPGMLRAVSNLGTDIRKIISDHKSPIFGFPPKNYYAEYLAVLFIINNLDSYFPDIVLDKPWRYEFVTVPKTVELKDLVNMGALSKKSLAEYNPGLTKKVFSGDEVIPASFPLRLALGEAKNFYNKFKNIKKSHLIKAENKISKRYKANGKESLIAIADLHGVKTDYLTRKLKKHPKYCPQGTVLIRSEAHRFSPKEIHMQSLALSEKPKSSKKLK